MIAPCTTLDQMVKEIRLTCAAWPKEPNWLAALSSASKLSKNCCFVPESSLLRVPRENVILCLHDGVAREPASGMRRSTLLELSGMELHEVAHVRRCFACELVHGVCHAVVTPLPVQLGHGRE